MIGLLVVTDLGARQCDMRKKEGKDVIFLDIILTRDPANFRLSQTRVAWRFRGYGAL